MGLARLLFVTLYLVVRNLALVGASAYNMNILFCLSQFPDRAVQGCYTLVLPKKRQKEM